MAIEAAVFDLDGTLVLSEERNRMVWEAFFAAYGLELDDALLRRITGRRGRDSLAEILHLFPGRELPELRAELERHDAAVERPPHAVPGAVHLVTSIDAAAVPLALVTSASREAAESALDRLGVRAIFRTLITAEDVVSGKPDPEGYLAACTRLGVAPQRAVGFEDTPVGIEAVKSAGMRCVGVATGHPEAVLAAADVVVTDLAEACWPLSGLDGNVSGARESV